MCDIAPLSPRSKLPFFCLPPPGRKKKAEGRWGGDERRALHAGFLQYASHLVGHLRSTRLASSSAAGFAENGTGSRAMLHNYRGGNSGSSTFLTTWSPKGTISSSSFTSHDSTAKPSLLLLLLRLKSPFNM